MSLTHTIFEQGFFRLGSVAGIPLTVNRSWIPVGIFVTLMLAMSLDAGLLSLPLAVLATALFYGSVLAHELGHALMARHFGIRTREITLHLLGGVAKIEREPSRPSHEALIALAGPAVSFVLAFAFFVVTAAATLVGLPGALLSVMTWLALVNLVLGVFNLIPGLPLDGGRVLRAWLWHRRGDRRSATLSAAKGGEYVGIGLFVFAGLRLFAGDVGGALMTGLLGYFVRSAARAEARAVEPPRRVGLDQLLRTLMQFRGGAQRPTPPNSGFRDLFDAVRRNTRRPSPDPDPVVRYPDGREVYDTRQR